MRHLFRFFWMLSKDLLSPRLFFRAILLGRRHPRFWWTWADYWRATAVRAALSAGGAS